MKKIYLFLCFLCLQNAFNKANFDFLKQHNLDNKGYKYSYPINFGFSLLPNYLRLFANGTDNEPKCNDTTIKDLGSIGFEIKNSWIITNIFSAKTFGFFPKLGIMFQVFEMNYIPSFFEAIFFFLKNKKWNYEGQCFKHKHFIFNAFAIFEPEIDLFQYFRCIPQMGVGISILDLYRKMQIGQDSNKLISNPPIDFVFLNKVSFIWKIKKTYDIHFVIGYTYNPLLLGNQNFKKLEGGIFNPFLGISFNWYFKLGLESIDWFDQSFCLIKYNKRTFFIDGCFGLGKWYTFTPNNKTDVTIKDAIKYNYNCNISCAFYWPYLKKLLSNLYFGIGGDFFVDIVGKNMNKSNLEKIFNNINLIFNFASFTFAYKTIRITHNFGIYCITNMLNIKESYMRREIGEMEGGSKEDYKESNTFSNLMRGRFVYRPRLYINIPKMIRKRQKYKIVDKLSLCIGINTLFYNRRNDYSMSEDSLTIKKHIIPELIKIESVFIGISWEF